MLYLLTLFGFMVFLFIYSANIARVDAITFYRTANKIVEPYKDFWHWSYLQAKLGLFLSGGFCFTSIFTFPEYLIVSIIAIGVAGMASFAIWEYNYKDKWEKWYQKDQTFKIDFFHKWPIIEKMLGFHN